jgi:hypothetical protein
MRELKMAEVESVSGGTVFNYLDPTTWVAAYNEAVDAVASILCERTGSCAA